jgi:transcriptional regulator NrdR family protein
MAMVKQSSSRYEQKRISRLESGIRAARQSGISYDQMKQIVRKVYRIIKQDTEKGDVTTKLDVDKWDGKVFNQEQEAVEV